MLIQIDSRGSSRHIHTKKTVSNRTRRFAGCTDTQLCKCINVARTAKAHGAQHSCARYYTGSSSLSPPVASCIAHRIAYVIQFAMHRLPQMVMAERARCANRCVKRCTRLRALYACAQDDEIYTIAENRYADNRRTYVIDCE